MTDSTKVRFYQGPEVALIPSKGSDRDVCAVSPHKGLARCKNIAPQQESFKEYRCDKAEGHTGPCLSYERTLMGIDTSRFCVWSHDGREYSIPKLPGVKTPQKVVWSPEKGWHE